MKSYWNPIWFRDSSWLTNLSPLAIVYNFRQFVKKKLLCQAKVGTKGYIFLKKNSKIIHTFLPHTYYGTVNNQFGGFQNEWFKRNKLWMRMWKFLWRRSFRRRRKQFLSVDHPAADLLRRMRQRLRQNERRLRMRQWQLPVDHPASHLLRRMRQWLRQNEWWMRLRMLIFWSSRELQKFLSLTRLGCLRQPCRIVMRFMSPVPCFVPGRFFILIVSPLFHLCCVFFPALRLRCLFFQISNSSGLYRSVFFSYSLRQSHRPHFRRWSISLSSAFLLWFVPYYCMFAVLKRNSAAARDFAKWSWTIT